MQLVRELNQFREPIAIKPKSCQSLVDPRAERHIISTWLINRRILVKAAFDNQPGSASKKCEMQPFAAYCTT